MPLTLPAEYLDASDLGANWRVQFQDDQGNMLAMNTFDTIDFGAISFKEVFQNVKTILATPIYSAALERTLGVDGNIVDMPVNRAAEMTIAVLDAITFWEPRAQIMDIHFATDLNGHLTVSLQLKVNNVIYGTTVAYEKHTIAEPVLITQPALPLEDEDMSQGPPGPPGPPGASGTRGSKWFTDTVDPSMSVLLAGAITNDLFINTTTDELWQLQTTGPITPPSWVDIGNIKGAPGSGGSPPLTVSVTISGGLIGLDVIPVAFFGGLSGPPSQLFPPFFEKASPSDDNVTCLTVDSITSTGCNVNLSAPAIAGQILHLSYLP